MALTIERTLDAIMNQTGNSGLISYNGSTTNVVIEVLGYYTAHDGGGGLFRWEDGNTTGHNAGTIIVPTNSPTGRWVRVFDSEINVKWFGAKGDWVENVGGTDDTARIQAALNYAADNNLNVYIPKGNYKITYSGTAGNCLLLDLTVNANGKRGRTIVYGAGTDETALIYDDTDAGVNVLKIATNVVTVTEVERFTIRGINAGTFLGTGLYMEGTYPCNVRNMEFYGLDTGIRLDKVNNSKFETMFCHALMYGVVAESTGTGGTLPNVLDFISCQFLGCGIMGAKLIDAHSINFISCDVSYNGFSTGTSNYGIYMTYPGVNGANGLNVSGTYFEGNGGAADIYVDQNNPGTHTFRNNTFNRTDVSHHTVNNIFITALPQGSSSPGLGNSKSKVTIEGNGFFGCCTYVPNTSRRTVELDINSGYWLFDVVEQGNTYTSTIDKPSFDTKTPQISEHTRVKAFGIISYNSTTQAVTVTDSYNILSATKLSGSGKIEVTFANALPHSAVPAITVSTSTAQGYFASVSSRTTTTMVVETYIHTGSKVTSDYALSLVVF